MDYLDPDQEHTDSVPHDRFDRAMWDEVREESEALGDSVAGLQREYDYAEDFAMDAFNLLAKGDPQFRSTEEMRATHIPNRQLIEDIASLPELQTLREYTIANGFCSAAGLISLQPALEGALQKAKGLRERAAAAQASREAAQQAAQDAQDNPSPEAQEAADQAAQAAQDATDQLQEDAAAASSTMRNQMRKALKDAAQEQEEEQEAMSAYGVGPGDLQRMNFADRMALAKRLNGGKLKQFAALIGAFRQLASAEVRRNSTDGSDEVVGVEFGDDLTRLTTQEYVNLAAPETESDFWRRFVDKGLLIKKLRGRQREGRGPIIVLADESGSMSGPGEMWAKGLALALLDQAGRQKRDFHYVGFASSYDTMRTFSFPDGKPNRDDVLDMAEGFIGGGTDFDGPLKWALDKVKAADKNRPDIVFITDGEAPVPSFIKDWTDTLHRASAKCFGIYVSSYARVPPAALSEIVDDVRTVSDLMDVQQAKDIMRQS